MLLRRFYVQENDKGNNFLSPSNQPPDGQDDQLTFDPHDAAPEPKPKKNRELKTSILPVEVAHSPRGTVSPPPVAASPTEEKGQAASLVAAIEALRIGGGGGGARTGGGDGEHHGIKYAARGEEKQAVGGAAIGHAGRATVVEARNGVSAGGVGIGNGAGRTNGVGRDRSRGGRGGHIVGEDNRPGEHENGNGNGRGDGRTV